MLKFRAGVGSYLGNYNYYSEPTTLNVKYPSIFRSRSFDQNSVKSTFSEKNFCSSNQQCENMKNLASLKKYFVKSTL